MRSSEVGLYDKNKLGEEKPQTLMVGSGHNNSAGINSLKWYKFVSQLHQLSTGYDFPTPQIKSVFAFTPNI